MLFYKTLVFPYDWVVVFYDNEKKKRFSIVNNQKQVREFYKNHKDEIWSSYNSRQYEQYIIKAILCGMNPYFVHKYILNGNQGYKFNKSLNNYPFINYDIIQGIDKSLEMIKAFNGNDITAKLQINRKLTEKEEEEARKICIQDVHYIANIFQYQISQYNAMMTLVKQFNLPLSDIGRTEAGITARILECEKTIRTDESNFIIEDYIHLNKYTEVLDFYKSIQGLPTTVLYKKKFECVVANVLHKFAWGGIHGAKEKYQFKISKGRKCWHIDVTSYYPSYLIGHDKITRSAKKPQKYIWAYNYQIELKKQKRKAERLPFKKMLNSLSGAMKDIYNAAYDPCMNNTMVVNCQLSTLMLIEMLEEIDGFELIQSNTDGLFVEIPDDDTSIKLLYDICHKWEEICSTQKASIKLEFDEIEWLYQKDVNNYIFKFVNSDKIERKGAYLKELSNIDNNTPILNKALVDYFVNGIDVETTINNCTRLKDFQIIRELSEKFDGFVQNEKEIKEKCIRVFASKREQDGTVFKVHSNTNKQIKLEGTPMNCFVDNGEINDKKIPLYLDREWYINTAKERLKGFGIKIA